MKCPDHCKACELLHGELICIPYGGGGGGGSCTRDDMIIINGKCVFCRSVYGEFCVQCNVTSCVKCNSTVGSVSLIGNQCVNCLNVDDYGLFCSSCGANGCISCLNDNFYVNEEGKC